MAITDKNTRITDIDKIDSSTKVRVWVEIINKLLDNETDKEYIFKAYSVTGQDTYDFEQSVGVPSNFKFPEGNYTVTYGGVVLQPDDYSFTGKVFKFVNGAPSESDYLITIRYEGKKNDINI